MSKDTLKQAEYIINGEYSKYSSDLKFKHILESSKQIKLTVLIEASYLRAF